MLKLYHITFKKLSIVGDIGDIGDDISLPTTYIYILLLLLLNLKIYMSPRH